MKYAASELIARLRMLLSSDHLVTLREVGSGSPILLDSVESQTAEGLINETSILFEVPSEVTGDANELSLFIQKSIAAKGQPDFLLLPGGEIFLVAECSADATALMAGHKNLAKASFPGRMHNRIVIITGGAQGFGAGLAESFYREGANLVIADMNVPAGKDFVHKLNSRESRNEALFVQCDVSDYESVKSVVDRAVLHFGGLDVMISNAGILRAGGLDEMSPESFELMTRVNYTGYFNCAKAAAVLMKSQSEFSKKRHFDIIQINSKSGLRGSNKNFAYAGGKFGGIGLTQSFALELMPYRIKVNSICPGNFFDGPLWSDPEKGLFVQYLQAGKIPGARTVEDVKMFYEKQVPAGRGCETEDVARAAFYAIEQEYETGQAIPVTGGQVMLN